jgi:siroheme synthase
MECNSLLLGDLRSGSRVLRLVVGTPYLHIFLGGFTTILALHGFNHAS